MGVINQPITGGHHIVGQPSTILKWGYHGCHEIGRAGDEGIEGLKHPKSKITRWVKVTSKSTGNKRTFLHQTISMVGFHGFPVNIP